MRNLPQQTSERQGRSLFHTGCELRQRGLSRSEIVHALTFEIVEGLAPSTAIEAVEAVAESASRLARI